MSHFKEVSYIKSFLFLSVTVDLSLLFTSHQGLCVFGGGGGGANKQNLFNNYRVFIKYSSTRRKV